MNAEVREGVFGSKHTVMVTLSERNLRDLLGQWEATYETGATPTLHRLDQKNEVFLSIVIEPNEKHYADRGGVQMAGIGSGLIP